MERTDLVAPAILGIAYDVTTPSDSEWQVAEDGARVRRADIPRYHRNVLLELSASDLQMDLAAAILTCKELRAQHPGGKLSNPVLAMPIEGAPALRLGDWL